MRAKPSRQKRQKKGLRRGGHLGHGPNVMINPIIGGNVDLSAGPFKITGTATSTAPGGVQGLSYQIIQGFNAGPILAIAQPWNAWSQAISATDCPTVGATYIMVVSASDVNGINSASITFTRTR